MIRGLIFDFDGLILDTEWGVYQSWAEMFAAQGTELPLDWWMGVIGRSDKEHPDPFDLLETQLGSPVDRLKLEAQRHTLEMELVQAEPILPGVLDQLNEAQSRGLKLGIASSSDYAWVNGNLTRLGVRDFFEVVHTSDDVTRTKPDPELYHLTLKSLGLGAREALVFEDSPNGVRAAKAAGIFTVAIPNRLTRQLDLSHADLVLDSLAECTLTELLEAAENF